MENELYHELILELNRHPLNKQPLEHFDVRHKESNPTCGDVVEIFIAFDQNGIVSQVGFTGDGCAISQAATSYITETIKGKTRAEINDLSPEQILSALGLEHINATRLRCATLGFKAIQKALLN